MANSFVSNPQNNMHRNLILIDSGFDRFLSQKQNFHRWQFFRIKIVLEVLKTHTAEAIWSQIHGLKEYLT
jgi:hypothetical protein